MHVEVQYQILMLLAMKSFCNLFTPIELEGTVSCLILAPMYSRVVFMIFFHFDLSWSQFLIKMGPLILL